jgi:hypothetical protein
MIEPCTLGVAWNSIVKDAVFFFLETVTDHLGITVDMTKHRGESFRAKQSSEGEKEKWKKKGEKNRGGVEVVGGPSDSCGGRSGGLQGGFPTRA